MSVLGNMFSDDEIDSFYCSQMQFEEEKIFEEYSS